MNGRGINVKNIRLATIDIDAVFSTGVENLGFAFSAMEATARACAQREKYPSLSKDLEVDKIAFVVRGSDITGAYMGELPLGCMPVTLKFLSDCPYLQLILF